MDEFWMFQTPLHENESRPILQHEWRREADGRASATTLGRIP